MKETEGFPPHFFTIHYYLLLSLQFIVCPFNVFSILPVGS
jgi:hypothetical protein